MRINTNVEALNANRVLDRTNMSLAKSIERLSSGYRINRGADDAAGLAVSEVMRSQIKGYEVAARNAQDGISLVQTADGALGSVGESLQRLRELAMQASNGSYTDAQRSNIQQEVSALLSEIGNVGTNTSFTGTAILAGGSIATSGVTPAVGPDASAAQSITFSIATVSTTALSINGISVATQTGAASAIASIDAAINTVTTQRASLGAIQNRLEKTIENLNVGRENLAAAESRIRNADMAKEMTEFTRLQILQQAGTAMLAQANVAPQSVLQLIG
jgi:flagellin